VDSASIKEEILLLTSLEKLVMDMELKGLSDNTKKAYIQTLPAVLAGGPLPAGFPLRTRAAFETV
jgi:hypothetical protein